MPGVAIFLFAGIAVSDFTTALGCYERLFGSPPASFPHDTEAVWELAEDRLVYVVQRPEHAGHAMHTVIVDDLDTVVAGIADRGLEPAKRETYDKWGAQDHLHRPRRQRDRLRRCRPIIIACHALAERPHWCALHRDHQLHASQRHPCPRLGSRHNLP